MGKSLEDFEKDGFTIYNPEPKKKSASPAPAPAPVPVESKIVVIDNKELVTAVERTNAVFQKTIAASNATIAASNETMRASIESLVATMAQKPDSFTLNIERDQRGFMTSVTVKINK